MTLGKLFFSVGVLHYINLTPSAFDGLSDVEEQFPRDERDWAIGDVVVFRAGDREAHGRVIGVTHEFITAKMEE